MSILNALRSRAFPTGNFENIKLADINNPNRMRYNIDATRDLDAIVEKLNTTFQEELKDEVEAQNFFLN